MAKSNGFVAGELGSDVWLNYSFQSPYRDIRGRRVFSSTYRGGFRDAISKYSDIQQEIKQIVEQNQSFRRASDFPSADVKRPSVEVQNGDIVDDLIAKTISGSCPKSSIRTPGAVYEPRWCDPELTYCDRVVIELIDTEKSYIRDLTEIIEGYLKEIRRKYSTKISAACLKDLFRNIEDIHRFNSSLVEELDGHGLDPVAVARSFVNNKDGFEVYTEFCLGYSSAGSILKDLMESADTAEILEERQKALKHNLPLSSYLLAPVQRILKYHLLLKNLFKHLDKATEGYSDIKHAHAVMDGIASYINEQKRKQEHAERVSVIQSKLNGWKGQELSTYGELLAEGIFAVHRSKTVLHSVLFDNMLLIVKENDGGVLHYTDHIMSADLTITETILGEPLCFHVSSFCDSSHGYTFQARTLTQKIEWCNHLGNVILESSGVRIPPRSRELLMERSKSKQKEVSEKGHFQRKKSTPNYLRKTRQPRKDSLTRIYCSLRTKKSDFNATK